MVRGHLIHQGSIKKKLHTAKMVSLLGQIHALEQAHRLHLDEVSYAALMGMRSELHSLLNTRAQKAFLTVRKLFHEHGNICGRLLVQRSQNTQEQAVYN